MNTIIVGTGTHDEAHVPTLYRPAGIYHNYPPDHP